MIDTKTVVEMALRYRGGISNGSDIKRLVNDLIDQSIYLDGFDLAVTTNELGRGENEELLLILLNEVSCRNEMIDKWVNLINEWNRSSMVDVVVEDGNIIYITDGFYIGKYEGERLVWKSDRVSIDGIRGLRLSGIILSGEWYSQIDDDADREPWHQFEINTMTGDIIGG